MSLTPRCLHVLLDNAEVRRHNEYSSKAALHGHKIRPKQYKSDIVADSKASKEQIKKAHVKLDEIIKQQKGSS